MFVFADPRAVAALVAPPSGDPKKDRRAFRQVLAQASDESRPGPLNSFEDFDAWEEEVGQWLWQGWPEGIHPHPGWVTILRAAVDEGPSGFGWSDAPDWAWALEAVMAVWLRRGPDTILPLLRDLVRPSDHPRLAFVVVHGYLDRGPFPVTPEILDLLERASPFVGQYDDETAGWLIEAGQACGVEGMLARLETLLTEGQSEARRVLGDLEAGA